MDALKSAGRALIRSPSLAKQSWGGSGRHRSECVRVQPGRAGVGARGPASCGPRGERKGLTRAPRPGATLPGPAGLGVARGQVVFPLLSLLCAAGDEGRRPELGVAR